VKLTRRDVAVIRDLALSHVLSRDQLIGLGYFGSVTRANTRLRGLAAMNLAKRLSTPFFGQSLYVATKNAADIVGANVSTLLSARSGSPRFIQHALATTDARMALVKKAGYEWRFEQQLWRKVGRHEVRPDGLLLASIPTFIEIDLGHTAKEKFKTKLCGYQALADGNACQTLYGFPTFRLLTLTTGNLRARHLSNLLVGPAFEYRVQTFADLGVAPTLPWS